MKKLTLSVAAAAMALTGTIVATPAMADPPYWAPAHGKRAKEHRYDRREDRRYDRRVYDARGRYVTPRRITRSSYVWRGNDGHYYCRRDNGTTGLVIGAGVGALAGHELAGRGDKTLGVVLGAALGGLLGREIDRGGMQCR
ncbi:MAG: glycine zipper 2TM domain-containing protein [Sphingomonadales bacterium]|nr:glycine zipper 2TM domain-containing protein [Sphingomonadales bacterium]